jgi:nucleotide-binding universal stress UspA family protein
MYGRILVTLDGSPLSEEVLGRVEELVVDTDASVTLLTVAERPHETPIERAKIRIPSAMVRTGPAETKIEPHLAETADQALARIEDEVLSGLAEKARAMRARGVEVEMAVRFGDPAQEIITYARAHALDAIAMATHGRTGLGRMIFGSVAGRILESGVKPVLLVRPGRLK